MVQKKIKIFCTLGPSSMNKDILSKLDFLGVDMFRINLSHTDLDDLESIIAKIRRHSDKPICLDTEGAQVRIGRVKEGSIYLDEGSIIEILRDSIIGNGVKISFNPNFIVDEIVPGDLISIDFDSVLLLALRLNDNSVAAKVVSGGRVSSNKAVNIDREIHLPFMSEKDRLAVKIGLKNDIRHFALSFANSKTSVEEFRKFVGKDAHIISKIESRKGLENLDDILSVSDSILIDRGDLSREEPIEKIPLMQKLIIRKANRKRIPVYVATNLLESMVKSKNPTRAEVNDIVNTLLDGADGLVLAAETAIGAYPVNCVTMINKTINQISTFSDKTSLNELQRHDFFFLSEPHGGVLVNRVINNPDMNEIKKYKTLKVDRPALMDAEQIGIGTFSPLEGFMKKEELESVLNNFKLPNDVIWPIPIVLQTTREKIQGLSRGEKVALALEGTDEIYAILSLEEIYKYDIERMLTKTFGTTDPKHPGVDLIRRRGDYFLGGKIDVIKRLPSEHKCFEITPKQARLIFENKGWSRTVGFHTRNVIHRVHEHIQMLALEKHRCDGIFVHPVVGPKKRDDYSEGIILECYELMIGRYYPKGRVVLGAFQSYSRYAGPREAVFTALCRKNFGCSHFIVGRDHTGIGNFYNPYDVHELFDRLPDIGIVPIFFKEMGYCKLCNTYVEDCKHSDNGILRISGSEAREILKSRRSPPDWFMRKEISDYILGNIDKGERVFVQ